MKTSQKLYEHLKGQFRRALAKWGVLGTLRLLPTRGFSYFRTLAADVYFDVAWGVDTSPGLVIAGNTTLAALEDGRGNNWVHGVGYQPTPVGLFEQIISISDIEPHCYSFIDYGSGMGRVLLLASRLPFRRVVGVEYSPELHRIAERNLHSSGFTGRLSGPAESVCIDAVRYSILEEPVVLYFFHPFERPIMEIVRDNVVRSYKGNPRSIVVIYINPLHSDVWDAVGFFKRYTCSTEMTLYEGVPQYIVYKTVQ